MIYRVEFKKDGSVASCRAVESHLKNGGLVVYIEADDPEQAIGLAQRKLDRWKNAKYADLIASGLCPDCLVRQIDDGKKRCGACRARGARLRREMRELEKLPPDERERRIHARREEIAARRHANLMKLSLTAREAIKDRSNAFWDSGLVPKGPSVQVCLTQVLRAYDRDPSTIRAWLLARIAQRPAAVESVEATAAE